MRIFNRSSARRAAVALALVGLASPAVHSAARPAAQPAPDPTVDGYRLIYRLEIPVMSPGFNGVPVPYDIDASADLDAGFDRVGYLMELQPAGGSGQWVWASMAAFTRDIGKIGLPTLPSGGSFQRGVGAMTVASNVPGLPSGDAVQGNIELWPSDYAPGNGGGVPGASDGTYDFGDTPSGPTAGYGSFQIHATTAATTLMAYNRWGYADASDIGIGNSPAGHPDWTFRQNAADHAVRRLSVYVREAPLPAVELTAPDAFRVVQRADDDRAAVTIQGRTLAGADHVEVHAVPLAGFRGQPTGDQPAALGGRGAFSATLRLGSGWYRIEATASAQGVVLGRDAIQPFGVGEVFVTAGQSNSANHGAPRQTPADPRVVSFGPGGWRPAADPQPIATGDGGSPWPVFGDALAATLDVPIGLVSVGWGGTSVEQWLPGGTLYPRLREALTGLGPNGARAVLWHQGESDAAGGTSSADYAARLRTIIRASRADAGYDVPWGIARVGFVPGLAQPPIDAIVAGQNAVIAGGDGVNGVFAGPLTDDLVGTDWRSDGIHFNAAGLGEHGRRWAAHVRAALAFPTAAPEPTEAPAATTEPAATATTPAPGATSTRASSPERGRACLPLAVADSPLR